MKKHYIFVGFLTCALLLPCWAGAATIMDTPAVAETPRGEEATPAVRHSYADTPDVAEVVDTSFEEEDTAARLSAADSLHATPGDHTGWTALSAAGTLTDGEYYLNTDLEGNLTISAEATVTLCLGGHTIDAKGSGSVITVNAGATLNLCDCQGTGKVTGGSNQSGGGVRILAGGVLQMYGGNITGNQAIRAGTGGGVCVNNECVFNLYGGSVDSNTAITNGGGIYVAQTGRFTMTGGAIERNTANVGGGVYVCGGNADAQIRLSGEPSIVNNTADTVASNLHLNGGKYVNLTGVLADGATIGVSADTLGVFATVRSGVSGNTATTKFFSDDSAYGVGVNAAGQLILNVPVTVTYARPADVTGTVPADRHCIAGETITVDTEKILEKDEYQFAGWTNDINVKKAMATVVVAKDTTLYPVFYTGFRDTGVSTSINMTYGVDIQNIDLSDFVQSVDANTDGRFRFALSEELPRGLKLVNDEGAETGIRHILTGKPMVTPGDYSVKLSVTQVGGAAVLFSLAESPTFGSGELTLDIHIDKPALSASNFVFAPPENLAQDGESKAATVTPANNGIAGGIGAITVKYSPADPVALGTYQVLIDVAEGTRYQAAKDLTDLDGWKFSIRLGTPVLDAVTYSPTQNLSDISLPAGWRWADPNVVPTVVNSGYSAIYTPSSGGDYDWTQEEGYHADGTILRTVSLTVDKATPSYVAPTGLTATEGQTLADVPLPTGWSWDHTLTTAVGAAGTNTFRVAYTPEDGDNYRTVRRIEVQIVVSAATPETSAASVSLGTPQISGTTTTIVLTPTPADLLSKSGTWVIAARYVGTTMTDVIFGTLSGNTVTFQGGQITVNDDWRLFFMDGGSYAPLCPAALVRTGGS